MLFRLAGTLERIHAAPCLGQTTLSSKKIWKKMPPQSIGIETPLTNKPFHLQTTEY